MSRAFVDESDSQFQDEEVPEIKIPLPPGAANYMTPAGAQALQAELAGLRGGERPQAAGAVTRLAASGAATDRDELAVHRRRLREIDRRIEYLSRMLARLEVIDPGRAGSRAGAVRRAGHRAARGRPPPGVPHCRGRRGRPARGRGELDRSAGQGPAGAQAGGDGPT